MSSLIKVLGLEVSDPGELPAWAAKVRSVPTFLIFRDGREVDRLVSTGKDDIVTRLSDWIRDNT